MFKVKETAYVLGCTPELIYSYFKTRHEPVDGGLREDQVERIIKHLNSKNRKPPFRLDKDEIRRVQLYVTNREGAQMQIMEG